MNNKNYNLFIELNDSVIKIEISSDIKNKLKKKLLNENKKDIHLTKQIFSVEKKVPDVFRFILNKLPNQNFNAKKNDSDENISYKYLENFNKNISPKHIVLLLESPHKDEYDENLNPLAPALGDTGTKLTNMLHHVFNLNKEKLNLIENEYRIILVNPIQYQTSLNYLFENPNEKINKSLRNKVWKKIWENEEIKKDFLNRILKLNPSIIFNGCTKELKSSVNEDLKKISTELNNCKIFQIHHPSSWNIPELTEQFNIN